MSELKKIFEFVRKNPGSSLKDIAPLIGGSKHRACRLLNHLVYFNDLERRYKEGAGRGYYYYAAKDFYDPDGV